MGGQPKGRRKKPNIDGENNYQRRKMQKGTKFIQDKNKGAKNIQVEKIEGKNDKKSKNSKKEAKSRKSEYVT